PKDGFKAYFPNEPAVNSMGGFGGLGQVSIPGAAMPESFSMYMPSDFMAKTQTSVVVYRFSSALPVNQQKLMREALASERNGRPGSSIDVKRVRWLSVDADEISTPQGVMRVAFIGKTMYMAQIGTSNGRAAAAEENGFFDNFELIK